MYSAAGANNAHSQAGYEPCPPAPVTVDGSSRAETRTSFSGWPFRPLRKSAMHTQVQAVSRRQTLSMVQMLMDVKNPYSLAMDMLHTSHSVSALGSGARLAGRSMTQAHDKEASGNPSLHRPSQSGIAAYDHLTTKKKAMTTGTTHAMPQAGTLKCTIPQVCVKHSVLFGNTRRVHNGNGCRYPHVSSLATGENARRLT